MTSGVLQGDDEIRRYLEEVADVLGPAGARHTILLVGGALLAWHGLRRGLGHVNTDKIVL